MSHHLRPLIQFLKPGPFRASAKALVYRLTESVLPIGVSDPLAPPVSFCLSCELPWSGHEASGLPRPACRVWDGKWQLSGHD